MVKNIFQKSRGDNEPQLAKTIAFVHYKGGTGKTTSCLNIAGWLVKMNKNVLVIDLDPQGNATAGLGVDRKSCESSIYDVLFGKHHLEEVILETDSKVHLAPSSTDLLAAETHMSGKMNNTGILRKKMAEIEKYYDYILIDIPPGSTLLMINGIVASENIIIPLDSGVFAYEAMETLKTLILDLYEELKIETNIMMILLRGYSGSIFDKGPTKEIKKMLEEFLVDNLTVDVSLFTIPFSRKVYESQIKGMPLSHFAPFSNVGRVYKRIAEEIIAYSR